MTIGSHQATIGKNNKRLQLGAGKSVGRDQWVAA